MWRMTMFRASLSHPVLWHGNPSHSDGWASAIAIAFAVIAAASLVLDFAVTLIGAAPR